MRGFFVLFVNDFGHCMPFSRHILHANEFVYSRFFPLGLSVLVSFYVFHKLYIHWKYGVLPLRFFQLETKGYIKTTVTITGYLNIF